MHTQIPQLKTLINCLTQRNSEIQEEKRELEISQLFGAERIIIELVGEE